MRKDNWARRLLGITFFISSPVTEPRLVNERQIFIIFSFYYTKLNVFVNFRGNLSTYKELCSLASDLNQPDLLYKFMHLAHHNSVWNSKKGKKILVNLLTCFFPGNRIIGPEYLADESHLVDDIFSRYGDIYTLLRYFEIETLIKFLRVVNSFGFASVKHR